MRLIKKYINRKIIPYLIILQVFHIGQAFAQRSDAPPKLFLYSSSLPTKLEVIESEIRMHVVDVILATQKFDLVFSKIPDIIAPSSTEQKILKYKFRTDGKDSYRIELTLIDADRIEVTKNTIINKISSKTILYEFRLSLYEFILDKKLRDEQRIDFNRSSNMKILSMKRRRQSSVKNTKKITSTQKDSEATTRQTKQGQTSKQENSTPEEKKEKKSLWDLLRDNDQDTPWPKKSISETKKTQDLSSHSLPNVQTVNPFKQWATISLKTNAEGYNSLGSNQIHLGWKYIYRDLEISDIVEIKNEFSSVLGLTVEWVYYLPVHLSRLVLRTGMEIDRTFKTNPIDMNNHFLFRTGLGYRVSNWLLPSIYLEHNNLNYANVNNIGDGVEANTHTVKWLSLELALLGDQTYLSAHIAKTLSSSLNEDIREKSAPTGYRYGLNARYFLKNKLFGIKPWLDLEYRYGIFQRKNKTLNDMEIKKSEYSFRFGVYF